MPETQTHSNLQVFASLVSKASKHFPFALISSSTVQGGTQQSPVKRQLGQEVRLQGYIVIYDHELLGNEFPPRVARINLRHKARSSDIREELKVQLLHVEKSQLRWLRASGQRGSWTPSMSIWKGRTCGRLGRLDLSVGFHPNELVDVAGERSV